MNRRLSARVNRGRESKPAAAFVPPPVVQPPVAPTLTAPGSVAVFNAIAFTVSATTTDGDLDRIDFVIDPGLSTEQIVATDSSSPYSASCTLSNVESGDHSIIARAVRGTKHTDSAATTINVGTVPSSRISSTTVYRCLIADLGVTDAGGGVCSPWVDQKNSVSYTAAVGKRPTIAANYLGKRTGLAFSSSLMSDATLDLPALSTTPAFWFLVEVSDAWSNSAELTSVDATPHMQIRQSGVSPQISQATTNPSASIGSTVALGSPAVIMGYMATANGFFQVGTEITALTAFGNVDPTAGHYIGALSNGTLPWTGHLMCLMVTANKPTQQEMAFLKLDAFGMWPGTATDLLIVGPRATANDFTILNAIGPGSYTLASDHSMSVDTATKTRIDTGSPYTDGLNPQVVACTKDKLHLRTSYVNIVGIGTSITLRGNAYRTNVNADLVAIYGSAMRIVWEGDFTDSTNVDDPPVIPTNLSQARTGTKTSDIVTTTPLDFASTSHGHADVIVNMWGINDARASVPRATFEANAINILETQISLCPNAKIVVAYVEPNPRDPTSNANVQDYNAHIDVNVWQVVEAATGKTLYRASGVPNIVDPTDLEADGLHYNPSGNAKVAAVLTSAIQAAVAATGKV